MKTIPEFDGLRGCLATSIVIAHLYYPFAAWAEGLMDVFFALSAFLIGTSVIRQQGRLGFYGAYFRRRIFRIWPSYYALFFIALGLSYLASRFGKHTHDVFPVPETPQDFFFVQRTELWFCFSPSCVHPHYSPYMIHSWSLAMEEQFYVLVLPLVWLISRHRNPVLLAAVLAAACLPAESVLRSVGASGWTLVGRFDPFALGLLLAFILNEQKPPLIDPNRSHWYLLLSVIPVIALYGLNTPDPHEPLPEALQVLIPCDFAIFAFFLLALLKTKTRHPSLAFLRWRPLMVLGEMSYSIYLWHLPVIMLFGFLLDRYHLERDWRILVVEFVVSLAVARAAYRLVERPLREFGRRTAAAPEIRNPERVLGQPPR